jgi:spore coat polysaccharide biosynthesis protein SpsF
VIANDFTIVVQARMTSARFPGKVLAPLGGVPILAHVVTAVTAVVPIADVIVATSTERSDDPIAAYAATLGVGVLRGPLDDVLERFRMCIDQRARAWVGRVNADSPLLDPRTVNDVIAARNVDGPWDLITTVFPRTFPHGQNMELIRSQALRALPTAELTNDDKEHVTAYFYRHSGQFKIRNIESPTRHASAASVAVDTVEDLQRLNTRSSTRTS